MKTQRELLADLMELATANPDLPIRVCASSDELLAEFGWTVMEISRVEINPWYDRGETVLTDEDEIKDDITTDIWDDNQNKNDEELEKIVKEIYDREVKSVICIYTIPAGMIK